MTYGWIDLVNAQCPLRIDWATWEDPTLVLRGPRWSFACTSMWRVMATDHMIVGCEAGSAESVVAGLENRTIEHCSTPTGVLCGDLRLELDDGRRIEVFVASVLDPWVFRLPAGPTLVPSPTTSTWFDPPSRPKSTDR